jgi:hypothetical protein
VRRFWDDNTEGEPGRINKEALLNILLKYTYIMLSDEDKRWIWWRVQKERPDMMNVVRFYDDMAADYDPLKDVDDEEPEADKPDDTILDLMERASETVKEAGHERRRQDTTTSSRDDSKGP